MSTKVERFRDHCRRMAESEHKPECPSLGSPSHPVWVGVYEQDDGIPSAMRLVGFTPDPPKCDGCMSDADRALFARLATEATMYLQGDLLENAP